MGVGMMDFRDRNCLVAYFSHAGKNYVSGNIVNLLIGNTHRAAMMVQKITRGDAFRINTVRPYPDDYKETVAIAKQELRENARPALRERFEGMEKYDIIFLGYPNWWNTMPMACFTFLDAYDFSGKTIIPFCTHEGSGLGNSVRDIRKACPSANVLEGYALTGSAVRSSHELIKT